MTRKIKIAHTQKRIAKMCAPCDNRLKMNRAAYDRLLVKRGVNKDALRQWVDRNNPHAKERLALGTGLSVSFIEKVLNEGRVPKLENCLRFSRFTGLDLDHLFPEIRKAAS